MSRTSYRFLTSKLRKELWLMGAAMMTTLSIILEHRTDDISTLLAWMVSASTDMCQMELLADSKHPLYLEWPPDILTPDL